MAAQHAGIIHAGKRGFLARVGPFPIILPPDGDRSQATGEYHGSKGYNGIVSLPFTFTPTIRSTSGDVATLIVEALRDE
jgi:hypothetical protein